MEWLLHLVQLRKEPASFPFMSSSSLGWSQGCSHAGKGAPVKCLFPNSSMLVTQQCSSVSQDNSKKGGKKRKWLVTVSVWGLVPQRHALELNQRQAIAPLMALLSRGHISSCEKRLIFRQKHKLRGNETFNKISTMWVIKTACSSGEWFKKDLHLQNR